MHCDASHEVELVQVLCAAYGSNVPFTLEYDYNAITYFVLSAHSFCSGFGRVDKLSRVSFSFLDGNYSISDYSDYLSTPVIVTALVLVSSGESKCSIEGSSVTLGVSWQEVHEAGMVCE